MKLMKDPSKTPYENALLHAGMDVSRGDGILNLKPKTKFISKLGDTSDDWDIEPDIGGIDVCVNIENMERPGVFELKLKRSYHTKWTVELQSVSEASDWYAYEHENCRVPINSGDRIKFSANLKLTDRSNSSPVEFMNGEFTVPSVDNFDFVGTPGIFLVDPDSCAWTAFLDVMNIIPTESPHTPQLYIVAAGIHARLGGRGPFP